MCCTLFGLIGLGLSPKPRDCIGIIDPVDTIVQNTTFSFTRGKQGRDLWYKNKLTDDDAMDTYRVRKFNYVSFTPGIDYFDISDNPGIQMRTPWSAFGRFQAGTNALSGSSATMKFCGRLSDGSTNQMPQLYLDFVQNTRQNRQFTIKNTTDYLYYFDVQWFEDAGQTARINFHDFGNMLRPAGERLMTCTFTPLGGSSFRPGTAWRKAKTGNWICKMDQTADMSRQFPGMIVLFVDEYMKQNDDNTFPDASQTTPPNQLSGSPGRDPAFALASLLMLAVALA